MSEHAKFKAPEPMEGELIGNYHRRVVDALEGYTNKPPYLPPQPPARWFSSREVLDLVGEVACERGDDGSLAMAFMIHDAILRISKNEAESLTASEGWTD